MARNALLAAFDVDSIESTISTCLLEISKVYKPGPQTFDALSKIEKLNAVFKASGVFTSTSPDTTTSMDMIGVLKGIEDYFAEYHEDLKTDAEDKLNHMLWEGMVSLTDVAEEASHGPPWKKEALGDALSLARIQILEPPKHSAASMDDSGIQRDKKNEATRNARLQRIMRRWFKSFKRILDIDKLGIENRRARRIRSTVADCIADTLAYSDDNVKDVLQGKAVISRQVHPTIILPRPPLVDHYMHSSKDLGRWSNGAPSFFVVKSLLGALVTLNMKVKSPSTWAQQMFDQKLWGVYEANLWKDLFGKRIATFEDGLSKAVDVLFAVRHQQFRRFPLGTVKHNGVAQEPGTITGLLVDGKSIIWQTAHKDPNGKMIRNTLPFDLYFANGKSIRIEDNGILSVTVQQEDTSISITRPLEVQMKLDVPGVAEIAQLLEARHAKIHSGSERPLPQPSTSTSNKNSSTAGLSKGGPVAGHSADTNLHEKKTASNNQGLTGAKVTGPDIDKRPRKTASRPESRKGMSAPLTLKLHNIDVVKAAVQDSLNALERASDSGYNELKQARQRIEDLSKIIEAVLPSGSESGRASLETNAIQVLQKAIDDYFPQYYSYEDSATTEERDLVSLLGALQDCFENPRRDDRTGTSTLTPVPSDVSSVCPRGPVKPKSPVHSTRGEEYNPRPTVKESASRSKRPADIAQVKHERLLQYLKEQSRAQPADHDQSEISPLRQYVPQASPRPSMKRARPVDHDQSEISPLRQYVPQASPRPSIKRARPADSDQSENSPLRQYVPQASPRPSIKRARPADSDQSENSPLRQYVPQASPRPSMKRARPADYDQSENSPLRQYVPQASPRPSMKKEATGRPAQVQIYSGTKMLDIKPEAGQTLIILLNPSSTEISLTSTSNPVRDHPGIAIREIHPTRSVAKTVVRAGASRDISSLTLAGPTPFAGESSSVKRRSMPTVRRAPIDEVASVDARRWTETRTRDTLLERKRSRSEASDSADEEDRALLPKKRKQMKEEYTNVHIALQSRRGTAKKGSKAGTASGLPKDSDEDDVTEQTLSMREMILALYEFTWKEIEGRMQAPLAESSRAQERLKALVLNLLQGLFADTNDLVRLWQTNQERCYEAVTSKILPALKRLEEENDRVVTTMRQVSDYWETNRIRVPANILAWNGD